MADATTESPSFYDNLENQSVEEILKGINQEDQRVALRLKEALPQIKAFIEALVPNMKQGGRLFYIGAGTSGRLGILDASECPPTFGVDPGQVVGLIAGGDGAIRTAVEFAEDDREGAWKDLQPYQLQSFDTVVGIAASGKTPYVLGGIQRAREAGLLTACITCNHDTPLAQAARYPMEVVVGPEFVTGSTRMKAGTAQKMVLNMISTTAMIQLGKIKGNRMVDMQLSNEKLWSRAEQMVVDELHVTVTQARKLLQRYGSVRKVLLNEK